ncbi:thrombospondin type 3 repeat-containing protein [Tenacibaculum haliotis]|uniref:thrombospondin type 3 repeat-containing protein n=1 Tax=Tenacibaculum haliotis TaxID=1888914 RepID=UPI0021AE6AF7|nr:thrombospondin type 3 repeat-containing protein [Tenacibaculum haliotis]MCT4700186.1 thrombospondin type 3 repeat-containing protein [Tenacibaculum haliotis]
MNKKILFVGLLILLVVGGVVFKSLDTKSINVEELRKQHAEFLRNHPFQKTGRLPKKERKAQGLPPNAYFEQKYLNEINPTTGRTHQENILKIQRRLNSSRTSRKAPGEIGNNWVERGPDNVGGRTRALLFDPNDSSNETVFAGGVSGGLWKNTKISDSNSKWVRIGIPENLAVSCIAADPNNSQIFYVGTGESYVNGDANGDGLWKSIDGGVTWSKVFGGITGDSFLDSNSKLTITIPSSISGEYKTILTSAFGANLTSPITQNLILVDDGVATKEDGCEAITNFSALAGKIAVIQRGTCNFSKKAKNAQDAGAVAVIVVNNQNTIPFNMSGGDEGNLVTIPSVMISKKDGEIIINALASTGITGTLTKTNENATNITIVPGIQHINDIVVRNNAGNSEVYIAAGESAYAGATSLGGDSYGVYKSIDGANFSKLSIPKTASGNEHEPNNMEISADNSIYLSTTKSDTFGDGGGVIFKSTDGITFDEVYKVSGGLRTEIAVSPTSPNTVYVLIQMISSGSPVKIFKTIDNFTSISVLPLPKDVDTGISEKDFTRGQAFYDLLLKVDPNNENVLYVGGIDLFKSVDGGDSWSQISKWSNNNDLRNLAVSTVHADQHGLAFASSNKMVFGNDGGVYFSDDSAVNILARNNNYNTLQFYTVGVAPTTAFNGDEYFIAGAQDNGTQLVQEARIGINSSIEAAGGDGAASFFDTDGTDQYFISNYVYNQSIVLYNYKTNSRITINNEDFASGDFINQEELDSNLNILFSNYSSGGEYIVRRYSNLLGTIAKNDLTNSLLDNPPSTLKVSPYTTGSSKLFLGLKNGKLLKVTSANINVGLWTEITGPEFLGSVSDIEFGENEDQIFVTMHNYGVISVWYTDNGGANWVSKEGNLPDLPVKAIMQNPLSQNEVIIGTDLGVWKTKNFNATSPTWSLSQNGMSNVPVLDLDLRDDNIVFAATYGRGVFSGKFTLELDPEGDDDLDGVLNKNDNCPTTANAAQTDTDRNGVGDVCQDTDGDGIIDIDDNCPLIANPDQKDTDMNGVGDTCQDSDTDGVMDDVDNCINTMNADQADTNNNGIGDICDTSYLNQDNISIQTTSETCVNQNDGKVTINVKQTFVSYTLTLIGDGINETKQLTSTSYAFENLAPGDYEVCVEINDKNHKQCFEITITEANTISLRLAKNNQSKDYTINVNSGTAPYNVFLNGDLVNTFNKSTFNVSLQGKGLIEVTTAKACEGKFTTTIDNVFLRNNPVIESIELLVPLETALNVKVTVFDVTGKVVLNQKIERQGNQLSIPFSNYKSGIYILKLGNDKTNTFKILKK